MSPRLTEAKRWSTRQAIKDLIEAGKLDAMSSILESAAIHIGQYGWWKSSWGGREILMTGCACIWLAVDDAIDEFGRQNPELRSQSRRYIEFVLLEHFELHSVEDLLSLNDRQSDDEGQGWAIYHLNTLAQQIKVRHRLQMNAQATAKAARS